MAATFVQAPYKDPDPASLNLLTMPQRLPSPSGRGPGRRTFPSARLRRLLAALVLAAALITAVRGWLSLVSPSLSAAAWHASRVRIWVPAYFYPEGAGLKEWDRLIAAGRRVPILAVMNPDSGPGAHRRPEYTKMISRARRAGIIVVGYVSTRHARRPLSEAKADVDRYLRFYPRIQGIHFDEQTSGLSGLAYYTELYRYVRHVRPDFLVISNPGVVCHSSYLERPATDAVCLFERGQGLESFRPPDWITGFSPFHFCILADDIQGASRMQACLEQVVRERIGYLYLTDEKTPNPYSRLPSYWEEEVRAVQRENR